MLVKDAIRYLQRDYKPDDEIIVAWWDKEEGFEDMTDEEWDDAVAVADHHMDWSSTHDDLVCCIEENKGA